MQVLGSHPRPTNLCFNQPSSDSDACSYLIIIDLGLLSILIASHQIQSIESVFPKEGFGNHTLTSAAGDPMMRKGFLWLGAVKR